MRRMSISFATSLISLALFSQTSFSAVYPPTFKPQTKASSFSDETISDAVLNKFFTDRFFSPKDIHFTVDDGVVTLTGEADNLRSKDRAVQIAETIKGVSSVIDRIATKGQPPRNDDLRRAVTTALWNDPTTSNYPIDINASRGTITLTGAVSSSAERNLTSWVVKGVEGVKNVKNDIQVRYNNPHTDTEILNDIKGKLRIDPWIYPNSVKPEVHQGVVTLTGQVTSAAAKTHAINDAWVNGTKQVSTPHLQIDLLARKSLLRSVPQLENDPLSLSNDVHHTLTFDPRLVLSNIQVTDHNGEVTLTGTVDSIIAKQAAENDAKNTIGVISVKNDLKINSPKSYSDAQISKGIFTHLAIEAPLIKNNVIIAVNKGEVVLKGKVDNPYQKWQAWDASARTRGVTQIRNKVEVQKNTIHLNDHQIKTAIKKALQSDAFIGPEDHVNFTVKQGKVIITGQVNNWAKKLLITQDAFFSGATSVTDKMKISKNPFGLEKAHSYSSYPIVMAPLNTATPIG